MSAWSVHLLALAVPSGACQDDGPARVQLELAAMDGTLSLPVRVDAHGRGIAEIGEFAFSANVGTIEIDGVIVLPDELPQPYPYLAEWAKLD